jgi:hypothetical protein
LHPFKNNALIKKKMKKVSLVFASLAMVAFVACNNGEEAPATEEVMVEEVIVEEPTEEVIVDEVIDAETGDVVEEVVTEEEAM